MDEGQACPIEAGAAVTDLPITAWKCEECRNWIPASHPVNEILVLEPGPEVVTGGTMVERIYIARKVRACSNCRREIEGTPEDAGFPR